MYKVLVTDYQWPSLELEREILADLPAELVVAETGEEAELVKLAPQADAILTCWKHVTPNVIDAARGCRIITRYGVGLDNIAVDHATGLGIPVTYSPTYCLDEVAEHAIGLLFALERRIVRFDRALRAGSYAAVPFPGMRRIRGRALGLLGYGNIARAVAQRARALGLRLLAHDPAVQGMDPEVGRSVTLEQLLGESDYLSLHVPLNRETRGIIDTVSLGQLKPGAFLINTARGGLVNLDAVLAALEEGRLAGAALDVYPDEPPDLSHPLFQHERFIATPHAAFYSEESVENLQRQAATQVKTLLAGGVPEHIVNPRYREHPARY